MRLAPTQLAQVILLASAAFALTAPAAADEQVYVATLSGAAESPPVPSPGTGSVTVTIDDATFTMRVQASFADLVGITTVAHIHCCTALPGAGNAGVVTVTPTFPGFPGGVTAGTYDSLFDMTLASSWNPAFLTAQGGSTATAFATLMTGIEGGAAYFNVHTLAYPSGEIRGFLAPIPEPSTYALMLAGIALVAGAARRVRPR
ncbi:MAG TPA: CHRD domain-containing protein [Burkholderiaceae bacterium]